MLGLGFRSFSCMGLELKLEINWDVLMVLNSRLLDNGKK